jgi:LysR family tcuABC transcriptional regulator
MASFTSAGFQSQMAMEIDSLPLLMEAVGAGMGATVQPWSAVGMYRDAAERFQWSQITDEQVRRKAALCSLSDDELSPAALAARVVLMDCARQLVKSREWVGARLV